MPRRDARRGFWLRCWEALTREARLSVEPVRWMRKLRGNISALDRSASSVGGDTAAAGGGCCCAARGVRKGEDSTPESTAAGDPPADSRRPARAAPAQPAALSSGSDALDALLS